MIDLTTAEHEAAHVVIGVALGLKLRLASAAGHAQNALEGYVAFRGIEGWGRRRLAFGVMYCAGVAYEEREGGDADYSAADMRLARECFSSAADVRTGIRLARDMMHTRKRALARVASELLERNLGPRDIERLVLDQAD